MKRMSFIRNSLETHDPKETTAHIRQEANKRRDERVLELWKKDIEAPRVTDIIQKFRTQREARRNDFDDFEHTEVTLENSARPLALPAIEGSLAVETSFTANTKFGGMAENSIFSNTQTAGLPQSARFSNATGEDISSSIQGKHNSVG